MEWESWEGKWRESRIRENSNKIERETKKYWGEKVESREWIEHEND